MLATELSSFSVGLRQVGVVGIIASESELRADRVEAPGLQRASDASRISAGDSGDVLSLRGMDASDNDDDDEDSDCGAEKDSQDDRHSGVVAG